MVCFPYAPGKRFDHDYYARNHMPMVMDLCKAHGLIRYEIDRALAGGTPGSPPPFTCIGRLYFDKAQEFQSAMESHGPEILGDVPNYTDIALQIQISEMVPS